MAKTAKNWTSTNTTASTWTTLVGEAATLASVIIANNATDSPGDRSVQLRLLDTAASPDDVLCRLLPAYTMAANESKTLDLRSMNIQSGQALQVYADGDNVDFMASGVIDA